MNISHDVIRVLKALWERWDVRGFMLLSLSLQMFLLFLAPLRKRSSNNRLIQALFCVYLLADWAANYAAGVIWNSDTETNNGQPVAFWATFLLVHLGGPDSMTAFTMQDNDFWHRHLLTLIFQCISAAYIFYKTFSQNQIWIPTLFMFVSGFIKYYERTRALYLASLNNLRHFMRKDPDPGLGYSKIMDAYRSRKEAKLPASIEMIGVEPRVVSVKRGRLGRGEAALYAHHFFNIFKRLIVDLKCSYYERIESREFFLNRTPEEAFKVIAIELNLMYDILFTKAGVVYNRSGFLLRLLSFALAVASFGLFYYEEKTFRPSEHDHKKLIRPSDVGITYTLLGGAIALDVIAFFQFVTSNWRAAFLRKLPHVNWADVPHQFDVAGADGEKEAAEESRFGLIGELVRLLRHRWSEAVPTFNLIHYCLSPRRPNQQYFLDTFGLSSYFDGIKYVRREAFTKKLRNHVFEELKSKSELAGDDLEIAKEASEARGGWAVRMGLGYRNHLLPYVQDMDYDQSLLTWHIATELCWCKEMDLEEEQKKKNNNNNKEEEEEEQQQNHKHKHRDFAKLLSDYMMYLVNMKHSIMYGVTDIGQTRLRDTVAEIQKECSEYQEQKQGAVKDALLCPLLFIIGIPHAILPSFFITFLSRMLRRCNNWCPDVVLKHFSGDQIKEEQKAAQARQVKFCKKILEVNAEVEPVCIKGDRSKSVLFNGCRLAQDLIKLDEYRKWEIMSKVWVEMLSYAAVHCRPQTLAQQLSRGGELISFVWLLMAHFGLAHHCFEVFNAHNRAKLILDK